MTQEKIQMFMMCNQKNFDPLHIPIITKELSKIDDEYIVSSSKYHEPTPILIISLFLGGLGIDRFMIGDIGMGVLKLLTFGGFGILTIIDWFIISGRAKEKNFEIFMASIKLYNMQNRASSNHQNNNSIDEIKKYKQLLDEGIITQEEFEAKKKELL